MGFEVDTGKSHLKWDKEGDIHYAYNQEGNCCGWLRLEQWGRHWHWSWHQDLDVSMSPGCLEEVRKKQKELFKDRKVKK